MESKNKNKFIITGSAVLSVVLGITYFFNTDTENRLITDAKISKRKSLRSTASVAPKISKKQLDIVPNQSKQPLDPGTVMNWLAESRVSFQKAEEKIAELHREWEKKPLQEQAYEGDLLIEENKIFFDEILGKDHPARDFYIDRYTALTSARGMLVEGAQTGKIAHGEAVEALGTTMDEWQSEMQAKFNDEDYIKLFGIPKDGKMADVLGLTPQGVGQEKAGESTLNMASLYIKNEETGEYTLNQEFIDEEQAKIKEDMIANAIENGDFESKEDYLKAEAESGLNIPLDTLENMEKAHKVAMNIQESEAKELAEELEADKFDAENPIEEVSLEE